MGLFYDLSKKQQYRPSQHDRIYLYNGTVCFRGPGSVVGIATALPLPKIDKAT
jgi:hypothetical protein